MKENIFGVIMCAIGGFVSYIFGGWSVIAQTLVIFMAVDYVMGLILAGVFKKSSKTPSGTLVSNMCWKGLFKKGVTLLIVLVATELDKVVGSMFIKDAVIIAFIVNETISIVENAGLMGVPVPSVITQAIEILRKKGEDER